MTDQKPLGSVLMTADPIGGVWTYALELCRELGRAGVRVALATMGRRLTQGECAAVRQLTTVEVFESSYKLEWMNDPWDDMAAASEWLLDLESRVQPALIHLNGYSHGVLRWRAPCLIVGHSCVYSWFEAVKSASPPDRWRRYGQMVTMGLHGADRVTAPSRFMLAALRKHYGGFAAADPVYNGRSTSGFTRVTAGAKEPFVITAGRLWDEAKNITALPAVAATIPWPLYAAGATESPDGLRVELDGLTALGQIDSASLAQWFGRAAIFVLPARYEPFGLSVLEAALAGCALVLGDIPSLREIWGGAALYVPADKPAEISAALRSLIDNGSLRRDLAERARKRGLAFTAARMARGYLSLYRELLSSASQRIAEHGRGGARDAHWATDR